MVVAFEAGPKCSVPLAHAKFNFSCFRLRPQCDWCWLHFENIHVTYCQLSLQQDPFLWSPSNDSDPNKIWSHFSGNYVFGCLDCKKKKKNNQICVSKSQSFLSIQSTGSCSASLQISRDFQNPNFNYRVHDSLSLVPILSQINSACTTTYFFLYVYFNISLPIYA
jgi:hypothetical protein